MDAAVRVITHIISVTDTTSKKSMDAKCSTMKTAEKHTELMNANLLTTSATTNVDLLRKNAQKARHSTF